MPETRLTETARKDRLTRRGELVFLVFQLVFWVGVIYFFAPAVQGGHHREHLTSTFFVLAALILFSCLAIAISAWLLLLAIVEAEDVSRSTDELQISYTHLGQGRLNGLGSAQIRKVPVRLFRFNMENGFEPAWLLLLGGLRLAVIPRARAGSSL